MWKVCKYSSRFQFTIQAPKLQPPYYRALCVRRERRGREKGRQCTLQLVASMRGKLIPPPQSFDYCLESGQAEKSH